MDDLSHADQRIDHGAARDVSASPLAPRWRVFVAPFLLVALLLGWGAYQHWQQVGRAEATREDAINFVPNVQTARAQRVDTPVRVTLPGQTEAFETAVIYARATGYIAERRVDIGSRVRRNQLLLRIAAPDLDQQLAQARAQLVQDQAALSQAQANVQQAQANRKLARVTKYRETTLAGEGWETQQNADTAVANFDVQEAAVANALAGVRVAQANIGAQAATVQRLQTLTAFERVTAPFDGVITVRNVDVGDLVSADQNSGTSLFRMDRDDVLRIEVYVPQSVVVGVRDGLEAEVHVPEIPGQIFRGLVSRSSVSLTQNSRTMQVQVDVSNPDGVLRSGLYVEVSFLVPRPRPGVVVPDGALVFDAGGLHVFVVQPNGTVCARPVSIYRDFGTSAELREGLSGGEELVVNPPADLANGGKVRAGSQAGRS